MVRPLKKEEVETEILSVSMELIRQEIDSHPTIR